MVGGRDDVVEVPEVEPAACGRLSEGGALGIGCDAAGFTEGEIHVVRQEDDAAIGSGIVDSVVLVAGRCVVACSGEDGVGHPAEPCIEVDDRWKSGFEGGS